jgi:hypothetical protein
MKVCERPIRANDAIGPCPDCGHVAEAHPGFFDRRDQLASCSICKLQEMLEQFEVCASCSALVADLTLHVRVAHGVRL